MKRRRDNERGDERGESLEKRRGKEMEEKIRASRGDQNERRSNRGDERGEHLEGDEKGRDKIGERNGVGEEKGGEERRSSFGTALECGSTSDLYFRSVLRVHSSLPLQRRGPAPRGGTSPPDPWLASSPPAPPRS